MARRRVVVAFGTRPEAIKLAPVIEVLRARPDEFETVVVSTAQHRQMVDQVLPVFGIVPDVDLDLMRPRQSLGELTGRVLDGIGRVLTETEPACVMVQGDTTTAFAGSLAAYYARIPVAHVEAGLRSYDNYRPFPEEGNRRLTAVLAAMHFAPTPLARARLLAEGVPASAIAVTGNTVVDALQRLTGSASREIAAADGQAQERLVLVTSHRRESWGADLEAICAALRDLVERFPDVRVVVPVHLNPAVRDTVHRMLADTPRIELLPPLDYLEFVALMRRACLILTDSGGVQEEAPSLGKPVLVLRQVTERPEAILSGLATLVGTDRARIVAAASRLLGDARAYRAMTARPNPYGDGRAAERIGQALARWSHGVQPLLERRDEFRVGRRFARRRAA